MRAFAFLLSLALFCAFSAAASAQLITPYPFVYGATSLPTGIAAYGLSNIAAGTGPYVVDTNTVFGYARINSMKAYNGSLSSALNVSDYGVSLQLNVVLNVTSGNNTYAYWLQDVGDFNTSNMTFSYVDNVWNATNETANMSNSTIAGLGNVTSTGPPPSIFTDLFNYTPAENFYSYSANSTSYSLPLYFEPVIRVTSNHGYPYVQFGYLDNGSAYFYDNTTLLIPNSRFHIEVTPYNQSGSLPNSFNSSNFYDAELVFGGEASGATVNFDNVNATLWMGYLNGSSITPFPYVADFGFNTAENVTNMSVNQGNGVALAGTGYLDPGETISLSGVPQGIFVPGPPVQPSVPTTSTMNQTSAFSGSLPSLSLSGTDYAIIAVVIIVLAAYYLMKSRQRPANAVQQ